MKRIIIFSIVTSWILTSCSPVAFSPTSQITPLPEKKGDLEVSGGCGLRGYEGSANYAINNHLAVLAQGRITRPQDDSGYDEFMGNPTKNNTVGFGLTYYSVLKNNPEMRWSVTGGANAGNTYDYFVHAGESYSLSAENRQFYIQPAYGFVSRHFESVFSCRVSQIGINNVKSGRSDFNGKSYQFLSAEPSITLRGGSQSIKAFLQTGYNFTNNNQQYRDITAILGGRLNLSAGVHFRLGRR